MYCTLCFCCKWFCGFFLLLWMDWRLLRNVYFDINCVNRAEDACFPCLILTEAWCALIQAVLVPFWGIFDKCGGEIIQKVIGQNQYCFWWAQPRGENLSFASGSEEVSLKRSESLKQSEYGTSIPLKEISEIMFFFTMYCVIKQICSSCFISQCLNCAIH